MVDAGSRCVARLNAVVAVATAGVVVFGFTGAPPPLRDVNVDVGAVRLSAGTVRLSTQWAELDQFIAAAAQFGTGVTVPTAGPSSGGLPATPMPLAATAMPQPNASTPATGPTPLAATPTPLAATPTPLAATPTPLAAIPIISDIGSAIGSAFWSFVGPLVNNSVVGPFVLVGAIFFGIFVVAPIMYVVESVQQFFAPLFGLLPAAAGPAAAKTVAPTAAVPDPTAGAQGVGAQGAAPASGADATADVAKVPAKAPRGFMPPRQKPVAVTSTAATGDGVGPGTDKGNVSPAQNLPNAGGVPGSGDGPKSDSGKSDPGKSDAGKSDAGKSLSRNDKSSHDNKSSHQNKSGGSAQSGSSGKGNS